MDVEALVGGEREIRENKPSFHHCVNRPFKMANQRQRLPDLEILLEFGQHFGRDLDHESIFDDAGLGFEAGSRLESAVENHETGTRHLARPGRKGCVINKVLLRPPFDEHKRY